MCKNMDNLNIGGVPLKSHAVLAPMAGVSDRAYRELCVRFGAAYCVSEMVSSKALSFNSKKSEELMEICLLYTSPSPRDLSTSRMPSSA